MCRLARDHALEIEQVDDAALDELRLGQRRSDPEHGLVREEHAAFGHRFHVAGEAQAGQLAQCLRLEASRALEPLQVRRFEAKRFEVVEHLRQARGDEESALWRQMPHEELENGDPVHAQRLIGGHHRQLVQVGQQCRHAADACGARHVVPQ